MVGELVGPYKIVRLLGEGGMGQVFEAEELGESGRVLRRAALKVLRPEHLGDAQMAARFVNEAKAIDVIDHPGVVTIYDIGTLPSGAPYIAMEFLDGESLRDRLRGRGVTRGEALQIGAKLASTLAVVHEKRIIHRDLKPENVMLCLRSSKQTPVVSALGSVSVTTALGDVKVLDFGIAKCLQNTAGDGQIKTRTGVMIGTPTYMAPEQCGGDGEVCERTDVYSLGVMLFEMLSGRPPFVGDHDAQIIGKQLFAVPPSLQTLCEGLEPQLAALVNRMLAKDIKSRPPMNEVEAELLVLRRSVQGNSEVQHSDTSATTVAMSQEPRNTLVDAAGHMQKAAAAASDAAGDAGRRRAAGAGRPVGAGSAEWSRGQRWQRHLAHRDRAARGRGRKRSQWPAAGADAADVCAAGPGRAGDLAAAAGVFRAPTAARSGCQYRALGGAGASARRVAVHGASGASGVVFLQVGGQVGQVRR
jgi:tRNA A-37 threonylcarbamoyl transferase component Bud32